VRQILNSPPRWQKPFPNSRIGNRTDAPRWRLRVFIIVGFFFFALVVLSLAIGLQISSAGRLLHSIDCKTSALNSFVQIRRLPLPFG